METMRTYERPAPQVADGVRPEDTPVEERVRGGTIWGLLRLAMGWTFLWAFLDKAFGLGFGTGRNPETGAIAFFGDEAWLNGGSPTEGVLAFATKGPLADFYQGLAGAAWVDWVYMLSMLLIGLGLLLGIGTRLAAIGGIIWMALFYSAVAIWPEFNPFLDDHVIMAIVLAGVAYVGAGRYLGLGRWWEETALVQRFPMLR